MKNATGTRYEYFSAPLSAQRDPLSDFLDRCSPTLKLFGWQSGPDMICGPRVYGDTELIWILKGETILTLNGEELHGYGGDLFVIPKHSFCRIDTNPANPHENYWMHLEIGDMLAEAQLMNLLGGPLLHPGKDPVLMESFRQLDACYTRGGAGSYLGIRCHLLLILLRILSLTARTDPPPAFRPSARSDSRSELLHRSVQMITADRGPATITELCARLYVSPAYLRRVFRDLLGESPSAFLRSVRLRKAEILLMTTDLPVSQIAAELGYASAYHFSNDFRRHHTIAPTAYRRVHQSGR